MISSTCCWFFLIPIRQSLIICKIFFFISIQWSIHHSQHNIFFQCMKDFHRSMNNSKKKLSSMLSWYYHQTVNCLNMVHNVMCHQISLFTNLEIDVALHISNVQEQSDLSYQDHDDVNVEYISNNKYLYKTSILDQKKRFKQIEHLFPCLVIWT
jgi:hypothetical protein